MVVNLRACVGSLENCWGFVLSSAWKRAGVSMARDMEAYAAYMLIISRVKLLPNLASWLGYLCVQALPD